MESNEDVGPWIGQDSRVVDLTGKTIIPGLKETHIRLRDLGFEQDTAVNLTPAANVADIQRPLTERLEQLEREERLNCWTYPTSGEARPWLFGLGWTQDRLEHSRMADRHDLDQVSREVPISLERIYPRSCRQHARLRAPGLRLRRSDDLARLVPGNPEGLRPGRDHPAR